VRTVYFDTSAYLKLLLDEPGSSIADDVWHGSDLAVSSRLAYAEVRAAIAAAVRDRRVAPRSVAGVLDTWEQFWFETRTIELTDPLVRRAGKLAGEHALTGADAVHLASAEALGDAVVATWDRRLGATALAIGLGLVPAA
jgi:predicted nucleic acid-binding protein